jgi:hypothetical protein
MAIQNGRFFLRGIKLVEKARLSRLIPRADTANAPPYLPLGAVVPPPLPPEGRQDRGGQWLNPWKYKPTIVFEAQDSLNTFLVPTPPQRRSPYYSSKTLPIKGDLTFIGPNIALTSVVVVAGLPAGQQNYPDFLRKTLAQIDLAQQNLLLTTLGQVAVTQPEGARAYPDFLSKNTATKVFEQQNTLTTLLSPVVASAPVGVQVYPDSTWKYKQNIVATQGNTTVGFASLVPIGEALLYVPIVNKYPAASFLSVNLLGTLLAVTGTFIITPSGGITFSGDAALIKDNVIEPTGTLTFSGTAPSIKDDLIPPTGQIVFSGSAPITFTSAGGGTPPPQLPLTGAGHS